MANSDERAGQPESMEQVIALYYDQIYKFCYWKTHSAVDAQDITQDTFVRFMDSVFSSYDLYSVGKLVFTLPYMIMIVACVWILVALPTAHRKFCRHQVA